MRTNLKVFRIRKRLTHAEMARIIGCNRATYSAIESGSRDGRQHFWESFAQAFCIPHSEMWELMQNDE